MLSPILADPRARAELDRQIYTRIEAIEADVQRAVSEAAFRKEHGDRASHEKELKKCANGVEGLLHWFDHWAWTFDPRLIAENKVPYVRFKPWPKQREFLRFLHARVTANRPWLLEKSRDQGATYLLCGFAIWAWLFIPGFKTTFCSNLAENVENKDNPDSIFEKLRIIRRRLPPWMLPDGFVERRHDNLNQLTNPKTGAVISGEAGDEAGRGGRSTLYVIDEAAHLAHPAKVESATSGNTDCIGWVSTPNPENGGLANFFARKRSAMRPEQVFRLHYSDDPRKDAAWAAEKKASLSDPSTWEAQYEISYTAATEGMAIPAAWVRAAVDLGKLYAASIPRGKKGITGVDVGGGKAKSVAITRFGPLALEPQRRQEADTTDTAYWALECALEAGSFLINYDAPGVGAGVQSTMNKNAQANESEAEQGRKAKYSAIARHGINTGVPPSLRVWPDGETSEEKFGNLKAELWWLARGAFQRSFLHLKFLLGEKGGIEQKWDEIIVIPDDSTLQMQLSTPKWFRNEKGKIVIETKKQLAVRRIPSPDDADAFVLTFLEAPVDPAAGVRLDVEAFYQDNPFVIS